MRFWNGPITSVRSARGRRFFPLDRKLKLRGDHWSEGAARVAVRQGLQAKSFDLAAEAYTEAVGGAMSPDSLGRVTVGWGKAVEAKRVEEAQAVFADEAVEGDGLPPPLAGVAPVSGQANL